MLTTLVRALGLLNDLRGFLHPFLAIVVEPDAFKRELPINRHDQVTWNRANTLCLSIDVAC